MPLPQKKLIPSILLMLAFVALAAPPLWWRAGDPPVIDVNSAQNNKGPVNIGQAKWMVSEALRTLDGLDPTLSGVIRNKLTQPQPDPGNPGQNLTAILDLTVPADPKPQDWLDRQKAPLLIGQLKSISAPFYKEINNAYPAWLESQLQANQTKDTANPANFYPWSSATGDDANNAIANVGQLKAVFSLPFESLPIYVYTPGTVTGSAAAPFIDAYDIYNLVPSTGAVKFWTDTPTHGQSFLTGSSPVELRSVSYKVDSLGTPQTKTYRIRVGTLSGDTFTEVHSETLTQTTPWNAGEYMTWSFSSPVPLAANTLYAVDVKMLSSSTTWQQGIPYIVYSGNTYPGGKYYVTSGAQTTISSNAQRDRIFHVDLAASAIQMVTVPDVVGLDQAAAESSIVAANLVVGTVTTQYDNTVPAGDVISQSPLGAATAATGTAVNLIVSLGVQLVAVPDVVALDQTTAESNIVAAQLAVGVVTTAYSATIPNGNVISQNPIGGSSVAMQSPVDLVVSSINADTDGDGIPDAWELANGFDPNDPSDGLTNADADGDGWSNLAEYTNGTDPHDFFDLSTATAIFKLDESSGTIATDSSGNGHHGSVEGGATWVGSYDGSNGLLLDGADDRVVIPNKIGNHAVIPASGKPFSMSFWFNVDNFVPGNYNALLSSEHYLQNGFRCFVNAITPGQEKLIFSSGQSGGTAYLQWDETIQTDTWYHVAVTYDGVQTSKMFVNGQLIATDLTSTIHGSLRDQVYLGFIDGTYRLNGSIDNCYFYESQLSDEQILSLSGSSDYDADGVSDKDELLAGTDPNKADNPLVGLVIFTPSK